MRQRDLKIGANDNALFVTASCNNHCLMCCQPPKNNDDIEFYYNQNIQRIGCAPKELETIAITGGEPTLLKDRLIDLIYEIRDTLPNTNIHLLSNGRKFCDYDYTKRIVEAGGEKLIIGIPLHSDYAKDHDIIAGAKNSYNETIIGLYNLASFHAEIELRIVINAINYKRLYNISAFIQKNLPFVAWTAFMGMERIGYASKNTSKIWIEPEVYIPYLTLAVEYLHQFKFDVDIYNIPLCLLPDEYHKFAKQSISEWKRSYSSCCEICSKKEYCCGLFSTSEKIYNGIHPYK